MAKYRRLPYCVDAFEYGVDEPPKWFIEKVAAGEIQESPNRTCRLRTGRRAVHGDWIMLQDDDGELFTCDEDTFEGNFERIDD